METFFRLFLLGAAALALPGCAWMLPGGGGDEAAQEEIVLSSPEEEPSDVPPRVIEPEVERREVRVARIDAENIEVGVSYGALSIEDFGTGPVKGLTAAYHVTEDIFFQAAFGRSRAGRTSYETLGGDVQLLTPSERRFTYYSLSLGYNLLPGEVYIGRNLAMTSALYLIGGVGNTKFAGDQRFTMNFGAGYRLLTTDWLAVHLEVQDRVFQSDLLGRDKLTNNFSAQLGLTVFF
jgi:outer membrane beta-barrel protein